MNASTHCKTCSTDSTATNQETTISKTIKKTAQKAKVLRVSNDPKVLRISDMLTYRRAHDSEGERQFIERYVRPRVTHVVVEGTTEHAYYVRIGEPTVAFVAHTDSVHNRQNPEPRQRVALDPNFNHYIVADPEQRDCLGADDAAGCYVLCRMIDAGVPGLYVFFRGEERGGIGSGYTAAHQPEVFNGIDAAIQFDRRATDSIITQMAYGRTCSNAFARSLAAALDMGHKPDPTGSFTDTALLAGIVPECTNLSVGYYSEHSAAESQDATYLEALTERCIEVFSGDPELVIEGVQREAGSLQLGGGQSAEVIDLRDMSDDDLWAFIDWASADTVVDVLAAARDELLAYEREVDFNYDWEH